MSSDPKKKKKNKDDPPKKVASNLPNMKVDVLYNVNQVPPLPPSQLQCKTLDPDEIEITYFCRSCNHCGKAFCRMPVNKEFLMNRVMNKVYIAHSMNNLLCEMTTIDVRMVNSKGQLV